MEGYHFDSLDPQVLMFGGIAGLTLGGCLLIIYIYRRLKWRLRRFVKSTQPPPGLFTSVRNLMAVLLLISTSGMLLVIGLFFQTYHRFTHETPVAEIITHPLGNVGSFPVTQVRYRSAGNDPDRYFILHGDQWMIEGDILKWKSWLNLLGLNTRYRLTRLHGRYLDIEAERSGPRTIFSLIDHPQQADERHPIWRFLYRSGQKLPWVDTVYGNAAYQNLNNHRHYQVFVGTSGFVVRQIEKGAPLVFKVTK
jgi:hypothetical protein